MVKVKVKWLVLESSCQCGVGGSIYAFPQTVYNPVIHIVMNMQTHIQTHTTAADLLRQLSPLS